MNTPEKSNAPGYYGNLARVAVEFYIQTGNHGEPLAAYNYARYAHRSAEELRQMLNLKGDR